MVSNGTLLELTRNVEKWYERRGRNFSWRRKPLSPFEVLVLEFLLWRTRASMVMDFFNDFIETYDSPKKLANADLVELTVLLKPLGLNKRRANLLIDLGRCIQNSSVPTTQQDLENLPGVGQYISRSVLCFGYDVPIIPVDVNVRRVLDRALDFRIESVRNLDESEEKLLDFLANSSRNCKNLVWGLIDLGALLCKKVNPSCELCPLEKLCRSKVKKVRNPRN